MAPTADVFLGSGQPRTGTMQKHFLGDLKEFTKQSNSSPRTAHRGRKPKPKVAFIRISTSVGLWFICRWHLSSCVKQK